MTRAFNIKKWSEGEKIITRGGDEAVILSYNLQYFLGLVKDKQIVWNKDGTNVVREEYGYDLQMKE